MLLNQARMLSGRLGKREGRRMAEYVCYVLKVGLEMMLVGYRHRPNVDSIEESKDMSTRENALQRDMRYNSTINESKYFFISQSSIHRLLT
jgi:hypothetical protein